MTSTPQPTLQLISQLRDCIHQHRKYPKDKGWFATELELIKLLEDRRWEPEEIYKLYIEMVENDRATVWLDRNSKPTSSR